MLHEDLNLILKKPYIESPIYKEYNAKQAEEMWGIFLQRNTSRIVDLLYGMTWNQIRCTECGEVGLLECTDVQMRLKYEPNNVLMLPMPAETYKITINILVDREEGEGEGDAKEKGGDGEKEVVGVKEVVDSETKETTGDEKIEEKETNTETGEPHAASETTGKSLPPKKLARQRVSYLEVQYNFYGLCSELYDAVAAHLDLPADRFDLVMKTTLEYDSVGLVVSSDAVHAAAPERPAEPAGDFGTAQQLPALSHCGCSPVSSRLEALSHRAAHRRVSRAVELHPLAVPVADGRAHAPCVHSGLRGAGADRRVSSGDRGEVSRHLAENTDGCRW